MEGRENRYPKVKDTDGDFAACHGLLIDNKATLLPKWCHRVVMDYDSSFPQRYFSPYVVGYQNLKRQYDG